MFLPVFQTRREVANQSSPIDLWPRRLTCRLGIDIGLDSTKIVRIKRDGSAVPQVAWAQVDHAMLFGSKDIQRDSEPSHTQKILTGSSISLKSSENANLQSNSMLNWSELKVERLAEAIGAVCEADGKHANTRVCIALSMSACDLRTLSFPKGTRLTPKLIQQSLAESLDDTRPRSMALLPNPTRNASGSSEEKQTIVRCLSIPEYFSSRVAKRLDRVGITTEAIDGIPWAIARATSLVDASRPAASVVAIDWSFGQPTLVSLHAGVINYVRKLSHGGLREIVSQPENTGHATVSEARRWIEICLSSKAENYPATAVRQTKDWITSCCDAMRCEIQSALEFLRWRGQKPQPEVILLGGGADVPGLPQVLQQGVSERFNCWSLKVEQLRLPGRFAIATALAWPEKG